jgi:hypothetical protein
MNNAIIICLVIAGFAVACLGIFKDGQAKASRRAHQEAMQRSEASAKAHHKAVEEDLARKQFNLEMERDRNIARIDTKRAEEIHLQKRSELWKGVVGPEVRAKAQADLDKASAEAERRLLGEE